MKKPLRSKFTTPGCSILICLTVVLASFPARAELDLTGLYGGLQYSDSKDEFESDTGGKTKENRGHIKLKIGKVQNKHFSAEGQLGLTTNSSTSLGIITYGAYARAQKDFGQYKIYGLIGLGGLFAYQDNVDDVSENGLSYGAGLEVFGSKNIAVTLEYVSLLNTSVTGGDLTFDTFGVGFTYYFIEDKSYFNKNRNKIRSIRY